MKSIYITIGKNDPIVYISQKTKSRWKGHKIMNKLDINHSKKLCYSLKIIKNWKYLGANIIYFREKCTKFDYA